MGEGSGCFAPRSEGLCQNRVEVLRQRLFPRCIRRNLLKGRQFQEVSLKLGGQIRVLEENYNHNLSQLSRRRQEPNLRVNRQSPPEEKCAPQCI
jgi:hypothetical protein